MKYLVVLLFFLSAVGASAQQLTLENALKMAEAHSHRLKEAKAYLSATTESLAAARAERFPTLSLDARASYIDNVPSLDIDIPGFVSLSRDFGTSETYQTDLRLTMPLYTGGRIGSDIEMARRTEAYRQALSDSERDRLYLQTRLDYLYLYRSLRLRDVALASLERTTLLQNDIRSRHEAGLADSVDLLEASLAYTKADFQLRQTESNIQISKIRLLTQIGLSVREQLTLSDTLPDPGQLLSPLNPTSVRPEQNAAVAAVGLSRARLKLEQSDFFPSIAVSSGYSYGKPNNDPFSDEWNDYFSVGAQLQWSFNLGGKTSSRKQAAGLELAAARHRHNLVDESIDREIELAAEQMKLAHERYLNSLLQFQISTENYQLARAQHRSGVLSSNRLLEVEATLSAVQSAMVVAKVEFYIAQSIYYHAIGDEKLGKGI